MVEGEGKLSPEDVDIGDGSGWQEVPDFVSGHQSPEDDPYAKERGDFIRQNREPKGETALQMKVVGGKPEFRWAEPSNEPVDYKVEPYEGQKGSGDTK